MQKILYFCIVKNETHRSFMNKKLLFRNLFVLLFLFLSLPGRSEERSFSLDDIILDIYNALSELNETDFEQLQSDLYSFHEHPIDLNHTSDEELSQLYFLSPRQIDDLLAYADRHPFESVYELQLIPSLTDYEIRDLLPFVTITHNPSDNNIMYAREVFHQAKHELIARIDARDIEGHTNSDPMQENIRYRFDYRHRVTFGAQVKRTGGGIADWHYGAYLQLRDIGHLHTLVAGNYQASFGQGLVFAQPFHSGKSMYVASAGQQREGLRYYSSVDGNGLHGIGATLRWQWNQQTRLDVSALYSMKHANDSTWHHVIGVNMTVRHKQLEVQLTAAENIWSDSIRPYTNAAYNQHYFRGYRQFVGGASFRYNFGIADLFGEVATAQNSNSRWGFGCLTGCRFYPTDGVCLVALYRYYSPSFDNALGYAFSETSRISDENGGYLGCDITRVKNWRFSAYTDVFYFSGIKYGIPQSGTIGYDAVAEARYFKPQWYLLFRARARKKGDLSTYSARAQFDWQSGGWNLRTTAETNLTDKRDVLNGRTLNYGLTVYQDAAYQFSRLPLTLRLRTQFFDCRNWDNRIYAYEHDVLYAFSVPAVYGMGGRAYLYLKWQIIKPLALYLRVSETVYQKNWAIDHNRSITRTDVHFLLRATL